MRPLRLHRAQHSNLSAHIVCTAGVEVGPGTPPRIQLMVVDSLQIKWTHNCEHGYVRGWPLSLDCAERRVVASFEGEEGIQFGPEQLVARLPCEWDDDGYAGTLLAPLPAAIKELLERPAGESS